MKTKNRDSRFVYLKRNDYQYDECDYFIRRRSNLREKTYIFPGDIWGGVCREYDYVIRKRSFLYTWDRVERASNGKCISRVLSVEFGQEPITELLVWCKLVLRN